jgi:DNA polymerase II small subunit
MIILPGNHDAVRPAEPQPAFTKEITRLFPKNVTFVGNPAYFTIHGIKVLAYHGRSMDDLIPTLGLSYHKPIEAMSEMLKRRHLAPIYGDKTPLAPEHSDYMVIDETPDIFAVGHVHTFGVQRYRNVLMINSSTWQSQTPFQKMMNIQPDPCKVTVVDLQAIMRPKVIDFSG